MLKFAFMGTPTFAKTILEKLVSEYGNPQIVITQPPRQAGRGHRVQPCAVQAFAEKMGLTVLPTENVNSPQVLEALRAEAPDLILVAAFGQLLKRSVLELPKLYCLNVHGSLLPAYRGAAPVQRAIWDGLKETGVSIQKMVKKMDAGDIVHTKRVAIDPQDISETLMDKLAIAGGEAVVETLRWVESGKVEFTPQEEAKATYAPKIQKNEAQIDWNQRATRVYNQVRALQPWPVAETRFGNERLRIHQVALASGASHGQPGSLQTDGKSFLRVGCGEQTAVNLVKLQQDNRRAVGVEDFLNAFRGALPVDKLG